MELVEKCPECGSQNLIRDDDLGEIVCGNCGFVIRPIIDRGRDWRAFTQEEKEKRARAGAPESLLIHDKGLPTTMSPIDYDAFGKKLPRGTKSQMWRLRKWQIRSRYHSAIQRNLAKAMEELDRLSNRLNIPKPVQKEAAVIYRKALKEGLVRGRSIIAIAAAALYAACRRTGTLRALQEIAKASLVSKKEIGHCYRLLLKGLNITMPILNPVDYISKIAEILYISGETQGLAIRILHQAREKRLTSGRGPRGIACAVLYIACLQNNEKRTQKDFADAVDITEVTVRNRYKDLKEKLNLEIPENKSEFNSLSFYFKITIDKTLLYDIMKS
ncbi:transcription initiation factor IIB [Patescibacteria group bacterium]|nr:transcription initiation factor IIB [Patescibacteria group bacterium]